MIHTHPTKRIALVALLTLTLAAISHGANEVDYKPGGQRWAKVWTAFYNGDHEPELMTPLIKAGPTMVPVIVEAIEHKNMRLRRYAIGALGELKDRRALDALTRILQDKSEQEYFRADALESIASIDPARGAKLAKQVAGQGTDTLKQITEAILKQ